jgi:hypothetical protein
MTKENKQEAINERIKIMCKTADELAELSNSNGNLIDILTKSMQVAMLRADIDIIISQPIEPTK